MKKNLLLFFSVYAALAVSQNLANGLQACYPLDLNAQNYASSGAALNGTLVNAGSTSGHTGLANTAYRLNGTVSSYIQLPDDPGLKNNSVFFSGWFRIDSLPNLQYLVYTSNGCVSNFEAYSLLTYFDFQLNKQLFRINKCGSNCGTKPEINSLISPVVGSWYHVCFYITNSTMELYVNGALQSTANHSVPYGYQTGKKVYLGVTNESNFNYPFKGAIDNVRFYNRALTQQEITQLYTQDPACTNSPVSIAETTAALQQVILYPNPGNGHAYIENLGDNTLLIYDLLGKAVRFTKSEVAEQVSEIQLQDAAPGIYLVKLSDAQRNYQRIVKLIIAK